MAGRFAKFVTLLAAGAGCANIIGVSDLEGEDEPGVLIAGRGGSGGSSGSGGQGKGGQSNSGGEAGEDDGSEGGTAPTGPVDCDDDPLELNEALVRGCILYESCYVPTISISTCVTYNVPDAFAGRGCAETARDCSDIAQCRHRAFIYPGGPATCEPGNMGRCENNIAINCDNAIDPHFADCDLEGGTCELQADGWADCKVVDSCAEPNQGTGCSGNYWYYCWDGVGYGTNCSTSAATCDDGGTGDYDCYYAVTSCNNASISCSGDTAISCDGQVRTDYDCGGANLECETSDSSFYCLAPGCEPDDWLDCAESCSGTMLTFCVGGAEVTIDCQDYGFDTCKDDYLTFSDGSTQDIAVCAFQL